MLGFHSTMFLIQGNHLPQTAGVQITRPSSENQFLKTPSMPNTFLADRETLIQRVRTLQKIVGVYVLKAALLGCLPLLRLSAAEPNAGLREDVIHELRSAGSSWSETAAEGYWNVNQRRLQATESVAPALVEKETRLLRSLEPTGKLLRLLEEQPEVSGLALLAFERNEFAAAIIDAPEADQGMLAASYIYCTKSEDVDAWTIAVKRHPRIIATFQRRCAVLPFQGIFSYCSYPSSHSTMKVPEAQEIYGKWLDEILEPSVIGQSDETLSSRYSFVAEAGRTLRIRLDGDPQFRREFLPAIWPRFRDSVIQLSLDHGGRAALFYLFGSEPLVWDFFRRQDAPRLFHNAGMDAVTMLCGDHALPADLQKAAVPLWAKGILDLPRCMSYYQESPAFCTLVAKTGGDWSLLNAVCLCLEEKGLVGSDLPGVFVDLFDLGCLVVTLGGAEVEIAGRKAAEEALKQTLKTGAKESMEKVAGRTIKELEKDAMHELERKALAKPLTEAEIATLENLKKGSTQAEWTQVLFKSACEQLPRSIRQKIVDAGCVEITTPVREGCKFAKNLGIGRESFKALTGLEARLFMRQDGRVFINFFNVATRPSPAVFFLTRTIENGALQSTPAHELTKGTAGVLHQWREDVSAWWSGHATGQFAN